MIFRELQGVCVASRLARTDEDVEADQILLEVEPKTWVASPHIALHFFRELFF